MTSYLRNLDLDKPIPPPSLKNINNEDEFKQNKNNS